LSQRASARTCGGARQREELMTIEQVPQDQWSLGDHYERYIGRWSRLVARHFVTWLTLPPALHWLDVGCGTGALTQAILEDGAPASVLGIDPSPGFIALARGQVDDTRASFQSGAAQALPIAAASVDAVVSGLVLNFTPDPAASLAEMARAARPGGTVAAYVWDYAEGMQMLRLFWDAASALDRGALALDEGRRFPICHREALGALWRDSGLAQIECRDIDVPTVFSSFEDFWSPFLGGQGPAPTYCSTLTEEARAALRDRLRAMLPAAADGRIALTARALAVRGVRPEA
jgi:SAM-dependent methyltransferase